MSILRRVRPHSLPVIGIVLACGFWFAGSALDVFVFEKYRLYAESLLGPDAIDLWSRSQVIFLLILFSLASMLLLQRQRRITKKLSAYKNQLEVVVEERTNELIAKNSQLECEIEDKQKIEARLKYLATIDPLTSIYNRRKFNEVLSYELRRDERYPSGLSLVLCDLDNFKTINDTYGHNTGDEVLKSFTSMAKDLIRSSDTFARWGGEEFVLLLPEAGFETAIQIAEKIRQETENSLFSNTCKITASFGVTQFLEGDTETALINRADEALYKAKTNGRNRLEVNPPLHILLKALSGV
jgi:diguanylate cyclase (GGDEF)-like protein